MAKKSIRYTFDFLKFEIQKNSIRYTFDFLKFEFQKSRMYIESNFFFNSNFKKVEYVSNRSASDTFARYLSNFANNSGFFSLAHQSHPFSVFSIFGFSVVRSGSVRGPFGIRSVSVRVLFEVRFLFLGSVFGELRCNHVEENLVAL